MPRQNRRIFAPGVLYQLRLILEPQHVTFFRWYASWAASRHSAMKNIQRTGSLRCAQTFVAEWRSYLPEPAWVTRRPLLLPIHCALRRAREGQRNDRKQQGRYV